MIKVIDGKRYNTETAELIFTRWNGYPRSDFMSMLRHHVSGAIARGEAEAIVGQPVIPTITEVIRDIKHGDCTLSAIFSDGSERKLFNFFIDELSFSDSELIGKTETEAQALHSQKDLAYLRS